MPGRNQKTTRRVRPLLLILLWTWALCVFMTLDLFRNVAEFDAIRPRARIYRDSMIENVPLHRDIMKAWREHGAS